MPSVIVVPGGGDESARQAGAVGADLIEQLIRSAPRAVLGLATGSTPLPLWAALATRRLDLRGIRGFALDDYLDLPADHPRSYRVEIRREVVERLGLSDTLVRVPGDDGHDAAAHRRFEQAIADAGGIELQVLGIGRTGHIGFNEPGSPLDSRTRAVTLAAETREDNARFFDTPEEVPHRAITQGIGTILEARRLLLLAFGEAKADAVRRALEGPITPELPASAIQLHPAVTVVLDEAAASRLTSARVPVAHTLA